MAPRIIDNEAQFAASAEIVTRLGAELFTDRTQALLELVKNSYDADATRCEVVIERPESVNGASSSGSIEIRDDGTGMDADAIRRGWLTLSFSPKREQRRRRKRTKRGRIPLGEKGLGRLGAQLLGSTVSIKTRPPRKAGRRVEHRVSFDFADFVATRTLDQVGVSWQEVDDPPSTDWPFRSSTGTILRVEKLAEPEEWTDRARLERELGRMVNPFEEIAEFQLSATLDGQGIDVERVGRDVREAALQRWQLSYDGSRLSVVGSIRATWFSPQEPQRAEALRKALQRDRGAALAERIQEEVTEFRVRSAKSPWLLRFERDVPVAQIAGLQSADPDCGPFRMELDVVSRQLEQAREASMSAFDKQAEYRAWLKERLGVGVYRDGFIVASEEDLLRLGTGFTSSLGYYALRPANVLGFVAITAADNAALEETTDREGFRDTPAYRRFDELLIYSRDQINRALNAAGRTGATMARELDPDGDRTPSQVADQAAAASRAASAAQAELDRTAETLSTWAKSADYRKVSSKGKTAVTTATAAIEKASEALEQTKALEPAATGAAEQFDLLRQNYTELYETIGLGLVAEGVAHEITHVVERLSERARLARPAIDADGVDPTLEILVDEVDSSAAALRAQLRHLDPQLRKARTRPRRIDLGEFIGELAEYHRERLRPLGISLTFARREPATVNVVPGRLAQAIDNLVLNSEYWVQQPGGLAGDPEIQLSARGSKVSVSDSGPGVPDDMLDAVFEPYVTMKVGGRGLGLFIARQLLDLESCTLEVRSTRDGRNAMFVADLSSAVVDE